MKEKKGRNDPTPTAPSAAMPRRALIELWESAGLGMIVAMPTGLVYSNQTGGTSCLHPQLEGAYVPLRNDVAETSLELQGPQRALSDYFEGPVHRGTGATSGLTQGDADFIDNLLVQYGLGAVVRVDRFKLRESHEAWVWATLRGDDPQPAPAFKGLGPYPREAVLTWGNSD